MHQMKILLFTTLIISFIARSETEFEIDLRENYTEIQRKYKILEEDVSELLELTRYSPYAFNSLYDIKQDKYFDDVIFPLVTKYAWAIPNDFAIETIAKYGPLIEIGAGSGYWAFLVSQTKTEIIAYDDESLEKKEPKAQPKKKWFDVKIGNEQVILRHPAHNLFLCYPPLADFYPLASKSLELFTGTFVIFVGEERGKNTADNRFFDVIEQDFELLELIKLQSIPGLQTNPTLKIFRRIRNSAQS